MKSGRAFEGNGKQLSERNWGSCLQALVALRQSQRLSVPLQLQRVLEDIPDWGSSTAHSKDLKEGEKIKEEVCCLV